MSFQMFPTESGFICGCGCDGEDSISKNCSLLSGTAHFYCTCVLGHVKSDNLFVVGTNKYIHVWETVVIIADKT